MRSVLENNLPEEPSSEILLEMLEHLTFNPPGALSAEGMADDSLCETWNTWGGVLQNAHEKVFQKSVDIQGILERISDFSLSEVVRADDSSPSRDLFSPEKSKGIFHDWHSVRFQKWLKSTVVCGILVLTGALVMFSRDHAVSPPVGDISWETPISEEINVLVETLDNLEQGWSTFDTELALVDTRLETIYGSFLEEEWEEDYF